MIKAADKKAYAQLELNNKRQMKYIKFLVVLVTVTLIMTSCGKENLTITDDNIPEVESVVEIVDDNSTPPSYAAVANSGEAALATFFLDSAATAVHNYSLVAPSSMVGAPEAVFVTAWDPNLDTETGLEETTYVIEDVLIQTISQEGIDAFEDWEANGSDPDAIPDLNLYVTIYTGTITYDVSNITADTADVDISGDIVDEEGNSTTLSASITANLYQ